MAAVTSRKDALARLFGHVVDIAGGVIVDQAARSEEQTEAPKEGEDCGGCKGEASRLAKAKAARQARLAKYKRR